MRIEILGGAKDDLAKASRFYEKQSPGLGHYFLDTLYSDIDSLLGCSGTHPVKHGFHRSLSRRFPYAIYYRVRVDVIEVRAVVDCRRRPGWTQKQLRNR
jgi:hypothetical protein